MNIILITPGRERPDEVLLCSEMFRRGLQELQYYRIDETDSYEDFVKKFDAEFRSRITRHTDMLKYHSVEEARADSKCKERAFLSPVYDSISKCGYRSGYDLVALSRFVRNSSRDFYALGGIDAARIQEIRSMGFKGCGILGAVWNASDPLNAFDEIIKS